MPLPTIFDEIDRLFDELIRRWGPGARAVVPAELREVEDGWVVQLPVEGLHAGDLKVEVRGRRLSISGHRRSQSAGQRGATRWTRTQQEVSVHQTITLPVEVRPEDVEATIEGTTLTVKVRRR